MVTTPKQHVYARSLVAVIISAIWLASSAGARAKNPEKPYALIFGTVYSPDGRLVYGAKVKIRRVADGKKWELSSDHQGEFAQRVPAGTADYVVSAAAQETKGHKLSGPEVKVHVENDERQDIGLHLIR